MSRHEKTYQILDKSDNHPAYLDPLLKKVHCTKTVEKM